MAQLSHGTAHSLFNEVTAGPPWFPAIGLAALVVWQPVRSGQGLNAPAFCGQWSRGGLGLQIS